LDKLISNATANLIQELVLTDYSEVELIAADPRLIVLAPFTVSTKLDKATLKQKVAQWCEQINESYPVTAELSDALNIMGLLLLNRFRDLSHQEIIDMLNLDLMQSRAGRDIYQIGMIEGKQAGLVEGERLVVTRLLEKRFGRLPESLQIRLEQATLAELEQWSLELLTANCLDDIFKTQ